MSKSRIVNTQHLNRPKSEKAKIAANLIPKIIFEDDDVIVLDKPPGLLVHPRQNEKDGGEPTLVDWLIEKYPQIKNVGDVEAARRPGIVHRLDKETSGLMVAAKTPAAFDHLKKQFHDRLVKKEYLAAAYGKIKSDVGRIELAIGRSTIGGKMAARAKGEEGKPAMTEFEVLERGSKSTLVKIFAKTGRTHQIRVHFFALGHPLVGDPLYQSKKYKKIPGERLMLHARKLAFQGLDGEEKTFTAPLPPEFKIFASF